MITIKYEKENNCVAAYDCERQVGVCQYSAMPDKWVINHTFTDPEYSGQGIARKMVDCVAQQADQAAVKLEATCWYAKKVLNGGNK